MGAAGLSLGHLLIVLVVIVLVFGTRKLRDVGGDLGAALRDFRAALGSEPEVPATKEPAAGAETPAANHAPMPAASAPPQYDGAPGRS
jgi:sec-independent protein translocase protein TatA